MKDETRRIISAKLQLAGVKLQLAGTGVKVGADDAALKDLSEATTLVRETWELIVESKMGLDVPKGGS